MRDWEPKKVNASHVRRAAKLWAADGGFLNFHNSTRYDVIIDGNPFPPKAIASIAHQLATDKVLFAHEFGGAREGLWHRRLKELGFEICEKRSGDVFQNQVSKSSKLSRTERLKKIAKDAGRPPTKKLVTVARYARSPHVVAERLHLAKGVCEKCGSDAPFRRQRDNTPYLEVHHIKLLSEGGLDIVENTQALCPNCHSEVHDQLRVDFQTD